MIAIDNEIAVAAPPSKVWQLLADLPRYRSWHPFIRLTGKAELGAELDYEYTSILRTKRVRHSPARITRFEPGQALEWTMGIGSFFVQVERYELARHPLGTRLRHCVEYRGLVSILFRGASSSAAHARMCEADDAIRTHLAGKNTPPRPQSPPCRGQRRR